MLPVNDALKLNVADEAVTPIGSVNAAPAAFAKQNGGDWNALANVKPQTVAAPPHTTAPTSSVEFGFIAGVVPHVPTVGVVPDETVCP